MRAFAPVQQLDTNRRGLIDVPLAFDDAHSALEKDNTVSIALTFTQ